MNNEEWDEVERTISGIVNGVALGAIIWILLAVLWSIVHHG